MENNKPKSKRDSYNGVTIYLHSHFNVKMTPEQVNQFMIEYRESRGSIPSANASKNAQYIQRAFGPFVRYCKSKLERRELING